MTLELVIERRFSAPLDLVWDAWSSPDSKVGWWGPEGFTCDLNEMDFREGGRYRCEMRDPDGTRLVNIGGYTEIRPKTRIVMTHGWEDADGKAGPESLIELEFEADGDGTKMRFKQSGFESVEERDGHREGWTEAFDDLDRALARVLVA
ncbi:MAG: SRPBCC domain-containing protein [Pseudomonadota bacterium]